MKAQAWHKIVFIYIFAFLVFTLHAYAVEDSANTGITKKPEPPKGAVQVKEEHTLTDGKLVPDKGQPENADKKADKADKADKKGDKKAAAVKTPEDPLKKGGKVFAIMDTNKGKMKIRLFSSQAPKTVANFVGLAMGTKEWTDPKTGQKVKRPYYDGLIFHRIIKDFMIQGGDPVGNGTGGPGFTIEDEKGALALEHSKAGILSMAKTAEPNSGGSQFFITLGPTPHLNKIHAVFGEVVEGMDVLKTIGSVKTGANDKPVDDVMIKTVTITNQ